MQLECVGPDVAQRLLLNCFGHHGPVWTHFCPDYPGVWKCSGGGDRAFPIIIFPIIISLVMCTESCLAL